jgi:hypothetical protein
MELDVDNITSFLKNVSRSTPMEFNEQDDMSTDSTSSPSSGGGSTSSTPSSVKKWGDQYNTTRGKANQIDSKSVWSSGRTMGKTHGGPGYKWFTGLKRGVANPAQE